MHALVSVHEQGVFVLRVRRKLDTSADHLGSSGRGGKRELLGGYVV